MALNLSLNGLALRDCTPLQESMVIALQEAQAQVSLLLAVVPAKRMGELHACEVHEECYHFLPSNAVVLICNTTTFCTLVLYKFQASQLFELHPYPSPQSLKNFLFCFDYHQHYQEKLVFCFFVFCEVDHKHNCNY